MPSAIQASAIRPVAQQPMTAHPFRSFSVTSAKLLRDENSMPLWKYEVKGMVNGRAVTLNVDEKGLGNITLTDGGKTRRISKPELADLETSLAAYSKAQNYYPPQGVVEARIAIAEAIHGPAPTACFKAEKATDYGEWLNLSGSIGKSGANFSYQVGTRELTMLWQPGGSARQRPLTKSELQGAVTSLSAIAGKPGQQQAPTKMQEIASLMLEAARRQLAKLG